MRVKSPLPLNEPEKTHIKSCTSDNASHLLDLKVGVCLSVSTAINYSHKASGRDSDPG